MQPVFIFIFLQYFSKLNTYLALTRNIHEKDFQSYKLAEPLVNRAFGAPPKKEI